jgi:hypothetical protein
VVLPVNLVMVFETFSNLSAMETGRVWLVIRRMIATREWRNVLDVGVSL